MIRFILVVLSVVSIHAASHCVRSGLANNGDGTTWAAAASPGGVGAFNVLPATLTRGDIYYIADGSYSAYVFDDGDSGTTRIWVAKATVAAHGTSTGWDNTYGDGQAVWSGTDGMWNFQTAYLTLDGATGAGFGDSQYGFKVQVSSTSGAAIYSDQNVDGNDRCTNIMVANVEIDLPQVSGTTYAYGFYMITDSGPNTRSIDTLIMTNCWIKRGTIATAIQYGRNCIMDKCSVEAQGPGDAMHHYMQVVFSFDYSNMTIRNCSFRDAQQVGWTSVIEPQVDQGGGGGGGLYIYGNTFYARTGLSYNSFCNEGIFVCAGGVSVNDLKIYNNTIYGWQGGNAGIFLDTGAGVSSNVDIRNNIWVDCAAAGISDPNMIATTSNNDTSASPTFVDEGTYNFRLAASFGDGFTLGVPYNVDPDGVTRGVDGDWSLGAFQFNGAPPPPGGSPSAYGVTARVGSIRAP